MGVPHQEDVGVHCGRLLRPKCRFRRTIPEQRAGRRSVAEKESLAIHFSLRSCWQMTQVGFVLVTENGIGIDLHRLSHLTEALRALWICAGADRIVVVP